MHSYTIRQRGLSWRFVDREKEVARILGGKGIVEGGMVTVLNAQRLWEERFLRGSLPVNRS